MSKGLGYRLNFSQKQHLIEKWGKKNSEELPAVSEKLAWHPTHFGQSYSTLHCSPWFMKLPFVRQNIYIQILRIKVVAASLQYISSLTSVLNTPATVYQPFHVLITEKQWKTDSDWLVRNARWDANRNGRNVCRVAAEAVLWLYMQSLQLSALKMWMCLNQDELFRQPIKVQWEHSSLSSFLQYSWQHSQGSVHWKKLLCTTCRTAAQDGKMTRLDSFQEDWS